jgi:drug/metabolite transporter (DMT)-like permease
MPSLPSFILPLQTAFWTGRSPNFRGAICVIIGEALLLTSVAVGKAIGDDIPSIEIVFFRFLVSFLTILPVVGGIGFAQLRTSTLPMHFARSFTSYMGNLCLFWSAIHLTLADAITIQFSRPLIMVVIAVVVLHELVNRGRAAATLVGFGGVLLIARPFGDGFDLGYLVALAGAFFASLVILSVKVLSRTESTTTIMFYYSFFSLILSVVPAVLVWVTPSWTQLALLIVVGVAGMAGQSIFTHGIGLGETSFLMPFDYLRIVYSFFVGLVFFAEIPTAWSIAGALVIFATSLYLLRTEGKKAPAAPKAP